MVAALAQVGSAPAPLQRPSPTEIGWFFDSADLEVWRVRAARGPYRVPGDAATNSPGDWQRIRARTQAFLRHPEASLWSGPSSHDCVQQWSAAPPDIAASALRDAAFYSLVTDNSNIAQRVADILLAQATNPRLDFADDTLWCPHILLDVNPSFDIAAWLIKLLLAADYIAASTLSSTERAALDEWFRAAAHFFRRDLEFSLAQIFPGRASGDYSLSERARSEECDRHAYFDGPAICAPARYYNNRRAIIAAYVTFAGVAIDDTTLMASGKQFATEFLAYSVYPTGVTGDFERWSPDLPDLGWSYSNHALASVVAIADALTRHGDDALYRAETDRGALGTQGGHKSLRSAIRAMGWYVDGTYARYATDDREDVGDPARRITGSSAKRAWYGVHDVWYAQANLFYADPYIKSMYTRTGAGMPPYPPQPAPGPSTQWEGPFGIYPAVLFMFGGLEGTLP